MLTLKIVGASTESRKARLITQCHADVEKPIVIPDFAKLKHSSLRIILSYTGIKVFVI